MIVLRQRLRNERWLLRRLGESGARRICRRDRTHVNGLRQRRQTEPFHVFEGFDQVPFWKVTSNPDSTMVELIDLRFGSPRYPGFEARGIVDAGGAVHDARVTFRGR